MMGGNRQLHRWIAVLLAVLALGAGIPACSDEEDEDTGGSERWRGELEVDQDPGTVGGQWTDTVLLTINDGIYTLTHLTSNGNPGSLCDAEGSIGTLVSNTTRITPQRYFSDGTCQANEGPSGDFQVNLFAAGDSLTLTSVGGVDFFQFRLAREAPPPTAPTAP